jgi:phage terminase large subunit
MIFPGQKQPSTYYQVKQSQKRLVINQGGTRSGKTYSILQVIAEYCYFNQDCGAVISIVRKTFPALKATAYRDFLQILESNEWYNDDLHNKSEHTYWLFGNLIEFVSIDQPQKIRGRKRDLCFINEANELDYEDFIQLNIRTTQKMILDFNPSDEFHWIYDLIPQADFYVTTYNDNPFLPDELRQVIEDLKDADSNHWQVYGLGQRGTHSDTIYTHWKYCEDLPGKGDVYYGQDFGYQNPSAMVKIELWEDGIYVKQMLYQSKLTTPMLIDEYRLMGIHRSDVIYCDSAEPSTIEELCQAGYNCHPADKDVFEGIKSVKGKRLFICQDSTDLIKEIKNYKWKIDKDGKPAQPEQPVKFNDHLMDAMRYAYFTYANTPRVNWLPH